MKKERKMTMAPSFMFETLPCAEATSIATPGIPSLILSIGVGVVGVGFDVDGVGVVGVGFDVDGVGGDGVGGDVVGVRDGGNGLHLSIAVNII